MPVSYTHLDVYKRQEIYNVADLYGACIDADTGLSSGTVNGNVMTFMPDDKEIAKVFDPTDIALNMKIQVKPPADSVDCLLYTSFLPGGYTGRGATA